MEFPVSLRICLIVLSGIRPNAFWLICLASYSVNPGRNSQIPLPAPQLLKFAGGPIAIRKALVKPQGPNQRCSNMPIVIDISQQLASSAMAR